MSGAEDLSEEEAGRMVVFDHPGLAPALRKGRVPGADAILAALGRKREAAANDEATQLTIALKR